MHDSIVSAQLPREVHPSLLLTTFTLKSPHFFYIMRCSPVSATQTQMEYEVYRHKDATDEEFTYISDTFKRILQEDKDLCNAAQRNLNGSVFVNGELHPTAEKASPKTHSDHISHIPAGTR